MEPRYPYEIAEGRFRISNSTVESFLRCGVRLEFEMQQQHRHATIAMAIGTAVASGAKHDNELKQKSGDSDGATLRDIVDVAAHSYEREVNECEVAESRHEVRVGLDDAVKAARVYGLAISPKIEKVVAAEEQIIALVAENIELAGTPDCIEGDELGEILRETKTGQPWSQQSVDSSRQLTSYSILLEARFGRAPGRLVIDSVSRKKTRGSDDWTAFSLWSHRSDEDRDSYVELLRRTVFAMKAGIALPAPQHAWWCSVKWCPFAKRCQFFRSE